MTYSKWLLLILSVLILRGSYSQNFWNPIPYPDSTKAYAMNVELDNYIFYSNWKEPDGIYRSDKEIIEWDFTSTGYTWTFDIAFTSDSIMFLASAGCILRSEDLGITFDSVFVSIANIVSIEIDDNDGIWAGYPGGILLSINKGLDWDSVLVVDNHELFLDFAFGINDIIYTVSTHYTAPAGGFYKSLDYGLTWINSGLSGENANTVATNSSGDIFVGCDYSGIFRSTDDGLNWTNIKSDIDASEIVIDNEGTIFCGNAGSSWVQNLGVHYSIDNGDSWEIVNTLGMINKHVTKLYLDNDNYMYVLSRMDYGNQLYKSNNPVVGIFNFDLSEPRITLFPNPCGDFIIINIEAPPIPYSFIEIYNVFGLCVIEKQKTLLNNEVINVSSLVSGTYILNIRYPNDPNVKSILFNKY